MIDHLVAAGNTRREAGVSRFTGELLKIGNTPDEYGDRYIGDMCLRVSERPHLDAIRLALEEGRAAIVPETDAQGRIVAFSVISAPGGR